MSNLAYKIRIAQLLEKVIVRDDDFQMLTYRDGWSDGRVADELGTTVQQVVAVRKALYGSHFATPASSPAQRLEARLERLERRVEELERKQQGGDPPRLDVSELSPISNPVLDVPLKPRRWDQG